MPSSFTYYVLKCSIKTTKKRRLHVLLVLKQTKYITSSHCTNFSLTRVGMVPEFGSLVTETIKTRLVMHLSEASPWGPPPGHPREPRGICQDCQIFVARGCGGKYHFCPQRLRPRGQMLGICWSAVALSTIPGCCSRCSPFLERKRKERKKLYLPRLNFITCNAGNQVVYITALKILKES